MDRIYIHHAHARFHLAPAQLGEQVRLTRLLEDASSERLSSAVSHGLAARGLREEELICIRNVHSRVRLPLDQSDDAVAALWSHELQRAICAAIEHAAPGDQDLVRYPSRQAARIDVLDGLLHGQTERAWAWRQLGLWSGNSSTEEALFAVLLQEPRTIVRELRVLVSRGLGARLAAQISPKLWERLAVAQLRAAGGPESLSREIIKAAVPASVEESDPVRETLVERIITRSVLLQIPCGREGRAGSGPTRAILAALAVCDEEPAVLNTPPLFRALWSDLIAALQRRDEGRRVAPRKEPAADPPPAAPTDRAQADASGQTALEPAVDRTDSEPPSEAEESAVSASKKAERAPESTRYEDLRPRGRTQYAGLLFLIRVISDLGLPARITELALRCGQSVRAVLARLGNALIEIDPQDPALLAFCGLQPGSPSPLAGDPQDAAPEIAGPIAEWAAQIRSRLVEILAQEGDAASAQELLTWLCKRPAEVIADPGWIELHMPLDSVDTRIRRAGLDMDPDYVPWLGVVVRFCYA